MNWFIAKIEERHRNSNQP